jgi:GMP synthase (glutamine-hydrolysing)
MLLVIDNGSVFTTNISKILVRNNIDFNVINFEQITDLDLTKFNGFILSGRRKNEKKMNAINSEIINHAISEKKPLLGICYGAEILALTLGGTIRKSQIAVKGIQTVHVKPFNPLCHKNIQAYQSHGYEIAKLGTQLENSATSDTCQHEIIKHKTLPIFGTQFHPEMTEDGQLLIESFLKIKH